MSTDILLEPLVLYAYVCMVNGCGLVYQTTWVERSYETDNEVISHGLCRAHFDELMED